MKSHIPLRRNAAPRIAVRSSWSRPAARVPHLGTTPDSQILRGLVFGLPLGLTIWVLVALAVWWIA